jgi:hypothetical protein
MIITSFKTMKRSIKLIILLLALYLPKMALAYDFIVDGIYYDIDGDNAIVTYGDNPYSGDIIIPESVNYNGINYPITSVGNAAFYSCSDLKSVVISNSITFIGNSSFHRCKSLTTITIPNSVTIIGDAAFGGCEMLQSVYIPNSVTSIGDVAFAECPLLDDLYCEIEDPSSMTMGSDVYYLSSGNYSFRTLHVPLGSIPAYRIDNKWIRFFNNIVEIGSTPYTSIKGDVNEDGEVNIADVTVLIDIILSKNS